MKYVKKNKKEIKCTVKRYLLHGLTEVTCVVEWIFLISIQFIVHYWMFLTRDKNNKINQLLERCLRIIYNDKKFTFIESLENDNSVSIHKRNLRFLANQVQTKNWIPQCCPYRLCKLQIIFAACRIHLDH